LNANAVSTELEFIKLNPIAVLWIYEIDIQYTVTSENYRFGSFDTEI
jgi:hypothetical protein